MDPREARTAFGKKLQQARVKAKLTQKQLVDQLAAATGINLSRGVITNLERGDAAPEPTRAVHLADLLRVDRREFLLLAVLSSSAAGEQLDPLLAKTIDELQTDVGNPVSGAHGHGSYLTLLDFPHAFRPMTVVVGDKREDQPRNSGDLFVFTASTVDDRWMLGLGLPRHTEKLSDKVIMTASEGWLRERFGKTNILCIGSPASNLFAREYNQCFLFRFAISKETWHRWQKKREALIHRATPGELIALKESSKHDLRQTMRLFKNTGFVDFNYRQLKLGIDNAGNRDFAVVSIGRNPFAAADEPYFCILAAGVQHPGTAHAVKFLGDPNNFVKHPFGGVLEVQVPSEEYDPNDVPWHEKIEKSKADWHSVAQNLEYTPDQLLKNLKEWAPKVGPDLVTDVEISREEIHAHIELLQLLGKGRANSMEAKVAVTSAGLKGPITLTKKRHVRAQANPPKYPPPLNPGDDDKRDRSS